MHSATAKIMVILNTMVNHSLKKAAQMFTEFNSVISNSRVKWPRQTYSLLPLKNLRDILLRKKLQKNDESASTGDKGLSRRYL